MAYDFFHLSAHLTIKWPLVPCILPSERRLIPSGNKSLIHKNCIDFQEALYSNETSRKISCLDNFLSRTFFYKRTQHFGVCFFASYMRLFLYRELGKACFYYYSTFTEGNILLHKTQYKMSDLKKYWKKIFISSVWVVIMKMAVVWLFKLFIPFSFLWAVRVLKKHQNT